MIDLALKEELAALQAIMVAAANDLVGSGKLRASGIMLAGVQAIGALTARLEPPAIAPPATNGVAQEPPQPEGPLV